jgi:hypothetical protein
MIVKTNRNWKWIPAVLLAFVLFYPQFAFSGEEEGHKPCGLCHEMKGEKAGKIKIKPDTETINPFTGNPYGSVDGICVRCHPTFTHNEGHVLGIRPEKVKVPDECMGYKGQEKELTCLACHNPHPHETKYKFLRWQVADKKGIQDLCNRCHIDQAPQFRFPGH